MYPIPPSEKLIETRTCKQCGTDFPITQEELDLIDRLSPVIAGQKILLPTPENCPECRKKKQLCWRNESKLYKRKCDATGKDIISHFPPDTPFKVYEEKIWNSDFWDAKEYGRDFDFTRPFFEQFNQLKQNVPRPATARSPNMENGDYCNNCGDVKDSYLCFNTQEIENCYYCIDTWHSKDCIDCYCVYGSEHCYECIMAYDSFNVRNSYDVKNCQDSDFLLSCEGCSDCYGCFGLLNQKYHIYNTPLTKEAYEIERKKFHTLSFEEQKSAFEEFSGKRYTKPPLPNIGSENIQESFNVVQSKNIVFSRNIQESEDIRYASILHRTKLAMDYYVWGQYAEKIYSSHQVGNNAHSIYFCVSCWDDIQNLFYSDMCVYGIHNCFGCVGLRNGESYCILNKQYTKEEYEALVPKIIEHMKVTGEWGEFFPPSISHHGYNETVANIVWPIPRDEARKQGFAWSDYEAPFPKVEKIIPASKLPDSIERVPDDILNWAIECEVTGKPFRIVKPELDFYRKHGLPIPKKHPEQRHKERIKWHINY